MKGGEGRGGEGSRRRGKNAHVCLTHFFPFKIYYAGVKLWDNYLKHANFYLAFCVGRACGLLLSSVALSPCFLPLPK